ncbi:MAG: TlpA family protein disulfide reductase [Acidobacteriota bacterium]|nr:MAG: TlpA family protein disulfide reductase [Acidobacteriota bacterium]
MFLDNVKAFVAIAVSLVLISLLAPLLSREVDHIMLVSFVGFFVAELIFIRAFSGRITAPNVLMITFLVMLLMHSITIVEWFVWGAFGLPVVVACVLSVISAYFVTRFSFPANLLMFILSSIFVGYMYFYGWDLWLHRHNYGTFTGRVDPYAMSVKLTARDEQNTLISDSFLKEKIVLLDFWTTSCSICFQKFPLLQSAFDKYGNDPSILLLAVNAPNEEDEPTTPFRKIRERGYTFPVIVLADEDQAKDFGVRFYPTTFVVSRAGLIVYKGDIEGAVKMVSKIREAEQRD